VRHATAATDPAAGGIEASLIKQGYHLVRRNDQVIYCRSEMITGTTFTSSVCMTQTQIEEMRRAYTQRQDVLNQSHALQCRGDKC
jgi:hypothetical protein